MLDDVMPPDQEVIEALKQGIRDRRVVDLEYLTKGRLEVTRRRVEPYLLFRGQEAWYLEAYCLLAGGQRTFKLERIRSARLTDTPYVPRPEVDLTSGRSGQAFIPGEVATWSTVRFEPRWRRHLEDRGVEFVALPGEGSRPASRMRMRAGWLTRSSAFSVRRSSNDPNLLAIGSESSRPRLLRATRAAGPRRRKVDREVLASVARERRSDLPGTLPGGLVAPRALPPGGDLGGGAGRGTSRFRQQLHPPPPPGESKPHRAALTVVVTVLVNALILQLFVWVGADVTTKGFAWVLLAAAFVALLAGLINWQVGFGQKEKPRPTIREKTGAGSGGTGGRRPARS